MTTSSAFKSFFAAALLAAAVSPACAAKYRMTWLGNAKEKGTAEFKAAIEKASHGEIELVFDMDKWADPNDAEAAPELAARVAKGEAQIGQSYVEVAGAFDPRLWAVEAPFLIRDYEHMEGLIEGPVGADLLGLNGSNLVGLTVSYNGGASGIAGKRPIKKPEDLKGLRVGVYGKGLNDSWLRSLGAVPVVIGHKAPFDASLDAAVVTWKNLEINPNKEAFKYLSLPGSTFLITVTYINKDFYESLPEAYRTLIKETARSTSRRERAFTVGRNEECRRSRLARGVIEVPLSPEERSAFTRALRPAYRDSIEPLVGKAMLERIRGSAGRPAALDSVKVSASGR